MAEESVMRQGMETWLKRECQDVGISFLFARDALRMATEHIAELQDPRYYDYRKKWIEDGVNSAVDSMVGVSEELLPIEDRKEIFDLRDTIRGVLLLSASSITDEDIETIRSNLHRLKELSTKYLLEKVVECQVGKLGETGKFLRAYEITDPGDTVFSVGDIVPSEVFNAENVRVITLGKLPATGKPVMKKPDSSSSNPTEKGIDEPLLGIIGSTFDVAKGRIDWLYKNQFASFLLYKDSIDEAIYDKEAGRIPKTETLKPFTLDELRSLKEYADKFYYKEK